MATQPEAVIEAKLIKQLVSLDYEKVNVVSENELLSNLKSQLEKHNKTSFSNDEFKRITNHLNKGTVFEKAKILRDKYALPLDDGTTKWIEFLDVENWCQNLFHLNQHLSMQL